MRFGSKLKLVSSLYQLAISSVFSVSFDSLAPARLIRRFSQPASPSELPIGSLSRPSPRSRFTLRANLRLLYLQGPSFSIVVNPSSLGKNLKVMTYE